MEWWSGVATGLVAGVLLTVAVTGVAYQLRGNWRCRVGRHDWRVVHDLGVLPWSRRRCGRCGKDELWLPL